MKHLLNMFRTAHSRRTSVLAAQGASSSAATDTFDRVNQHRPPQFLSIR